MVSRVVPTVRTSSGAVAVQIVKPCQQVEHVENLGSGATEADLALLLSAARKRLAPW